MPGAAPRRTTAVPRESPPLVGDLQLSQDVGARRTTWRIQRIGWAIMALIILAALAGLFGRGPLSHASARSADAALVVRYERFIRNQAEATLDLSVSSPAAGGEISVWLDSAYLDQVNLRQAVPEPRSTRLDPGRVVLTFRVTPSDAPSHIALRFRVEHIGPLTARIGLDRGARDDDAEAAVEFGQFAYP